MSSPPVALSTYIEGVPGTTVVAYLAKFRDESRWTYSLWADADTVIASGEIDFSPMEVTPDQVARIAFLLECEYPTLEDLKCDRE